jgi:protein-arginine kinase activator protein McsA
MRNREINDNAFDDEVYGGDPLASVAVNVCENCGTSRGHIEQIWTDDGTKPLLCEDCAEEVRRIEQLADELAKAPSCPERQQILDTAETTAGLMNRLQAHDIAQCAACGASLSSAALGPGREATLCEGKVA